MQPKGPVVHESTCFDNGDGEKSTHEKPEPVGSMCTNQHALTTATGRRALMRSRNQMARARPSEEKKARGHETEVCRKSEALSKGHFL